MLIGMTQNCILRSWTSASTTTFVLSITKPRMPRHKGKVERGVGYVKNSALKAREFESLAAQNEFLQNWEATVADTRIHGTTKRHVGSHFEQVERQTLGPLPVDRFPVLRRRQTQGIARWPH